MQKHLKQIAKSYDKGIDMGRQGIDSYENLPEHITSHPDYPLFAKLRNENQLSDSARKEIREYLSPSEGMKFVDLGCCLNLMFAGYNEWESTYYGVDISPKTIELLKGYAAKHNLPVGTLHCGSMHDTPFEDDYFDIGACIGVLEYFERDFIKLSVAEFNRIVKPDSKFVLDIPNVGSPIFKIAMMIEEHLGRPDRFDISVAEFEEILKPYFYVEKKEVVGPMIQYFLRCRE